MEEIFTRRSIRRFEDRPIEKAKTDQILRAGMQAPSAGNQQPWEFIVVEDKATLNRLSEMSLYSKPAAGSAVTLVLLGNFRKLKFPDAWQQDMGAAAENILLEAVHLGLGAVWMGAANSGSSVRFLREFFRLPEHIQPFSLIAIGYPDGQKNEFTDRYQAEKVHYGKY